MPGDFDPSLNEELLNAFGLNKDKKKENDPTEATEAWFKAYWEGNATLPQSDTGVTIFLAASLLESPSLQLESFSHSRLSSNQLQRLGEMMNRVHRAKSIDVVSAANPSGLLEPDKKDVPTRVVSMERFLELWESAKMSVLKILQTYTKFVEGRSSTEWQDPDPVKLDSFFIENEGEAVILKKAIIFIRNAFKIPEVRDLLTEYRNGFKDPSNRGKPLWREVYRPKFIALVADQAKTEDFQVPEKVLVFLLQEVTE